MAAWPAPLQTNLRCLPVGKDVHAPRPARTKNRTKKDGGAFSAPPRCYKCWSPDLCLLRVPIGVYRREVLPLLRQIVECENCSHRAHGYTRSAIDALHWADVKLGLAFERRLI